jgi:hypothetical protein
MSFEELRLCVQKTRESLRSYISRWLNLRNTSENISPERAIDAFRDGLIRRDFREELGRCKPKTIDHLMSLANEWADGEDSIAVPRSRRRSADRDVDPKDQFHSSSRKKGRRNRYEDTDTADMVAAGHINNDRDDNHNRPRQGNNYYESSSRGAGRDSRPKTEWRRRRDQMPLSAEEMLNGGEGGVPGTPTSTRMEGKNPRISSSSAGSSFSSVKCFRTRCEPSNRLQVAWLTMHRHHHLTHQQTWCNRVTRPPRSSMSSNRDSRSLKKKCSRHHEASCP